MRLHAIKRFDQIDKTIGDAYIYHNLKDTDDIVVTKVYVSLVHRTLSGQLSIEGRCVLVLCVFFVSLENFSSICKCRAVQLGTRGL